MTSTCFPAGSTSRAWSTRMQVPVHGILRALRAFRARVPACLRSLRLCRLHRRCCASTRNANRANLREPACEDDQSFPKEFPGAMYDKNNSGKHDRKDHTGKHTEKNIRALDSEDPRPCSPEP